MKRLLPLVLALALFGCQQKAPEPAKGGGSSVSLPPMSGPAGPLLPPQDGPEDPPLPPDPVRIELKQPDNPEGASTTTYRETRTLIHPDGTVETWNRETAIGVGGSQSYAEILGAWAKVVAEYATTQYFKGLLAALALAVVAWFARKEWPTIMLACILSAPISLFITWWAGILVAVVASVFIIIAHYKTALMSLIKP